MTSTHYGIKFVANLLAMYIPNTVKRCFLFLILTLSLHFGYAQIPYGLFDGRDADLRCETCEKVINEKPIEVLFGIDVHENGDVYFSMTNKQWFEKLFSSPNSGISADIVVRDRYTCGRALPNTGNLLRGHLLPPLYKSNFKQNMKELQNGHVLIKIGKLPPKLLNKDVEGNLVIVNGNAICYYTNFVNIDRSVWDLLPMGLYTDSLIQHQSPGAGDHDVLFTYSKKIQVTVPFEKGKTEFKPADIKPLYDSLRLKDFVIRKIEIRAYSSVEGSEKVNDNLMQGRATSMISALRQFQPSMKRIRIIPAENWVEFFRDVKNSPYPQLASLSKAEIKQRLVDKAVLDKLEPVLATHRKAVVTVFVDAKTEAAKMPDANIITAFQNAITARDIPTARMIQKELVDRIIDNKLPQEYMSRLEVPMSKDYSPVLSDREVYKFLLQHTSEYEALENFEAIKKLDPNNGRVNYNICALRFFLWQHGDSINTKSFSQEINALEKLGISNSLVKRMQINYHILMCNEYMNTFNYAAKDQSLVYIRNTYPPLNLNDEEIFSLAKYFSFYSRQNWAEELVEPRIDKIDASEDLVFYYVNLGFYHPSEYSTEKFRDAMLNAINLDRERFCKFFVVIDKGGASMQLLEDDDLRRIYCENCTGVFRL